jgi:molybdopterin/thiamine biosynthesis adenylyltransferase/proteasome lid subunit RPN8/RPN11
VIVSDAVLRAIEAEIAAHDPERGGALLGPRGRALVTDLVPDGAGASTASTYRPSRALAAEVAACERGGELELKGIVHSHPPGFDEPSRQDVAELAEGLRRNGHMPSYLAPIVTRGPAHALAAHELALPSGKISFFAGQRTREGGAKVRPVPVRVLPLLRDLERASRALGGADPEISLSELEEAAVLAGRIRLPGDVELLVLAGEGYPSLPPVVLATSQEGATEQLDVAWRIQLPEDERLARALAAAFSPPGPYRRAYGPAGGHALTADAERARLAGWPGRLTGADPAAEAARLRAALHARSAGLLSAALGARDVLVAGLGSVGSYVAEQLARAGVGGLALIDPESVEAANLSRSAYEAGDVGRPKVEALAGRLLRVQPALRLALHACAVEALPPPALDAAIRAADLVIAATDDPAAQRALDRFAYARGRPALFVGIYAGAQGGEVVMTVPGRTPCYLCATRTRRGVERAGGAVSAEVDYGTARLRAEIALGADVHHVASAAVKLALSLLIEPGDGAALASFAEVALADGTPFLTLSTVPAYWFYPQVFGDTPGQGAYQSVWLTPSPAPDCPVCGDPANRVDPLDVPARPPRREALAALLRDADRDVPG